MFIVKVLRRIYFFLAFNLYAKQKISKTDIIKLLGFSIEIPPTVFHPSLYFSSKFLGEFLLTLDLTGKHVLDMGCGSGMLSLVAATRGAKVTSIDINDAAVHATRHNAKINSLEASITAFASNLFDGLINTNMFDLILVNPPFYPNDPAELAEYAWKGGVHYNFIDQFTLHLNNYLTANGKAIFICSSDMDIIKVTTLFEKRHFTLQCLKQKRVLFERLYIYEAVRNP